MPTPLPTPEATLLVPPDAEEVLIISRGVASAVAPATGLTRTQELLMRAVFVAMTGCEATLGAPPITADEFAAALAGRNEVFRARIVQIMILLSLVLRPLPEEVAQRVAAFAGELLVKEDMLDVARRFAEGSLGLAAVDFERNGYASTWHPDDAAALHTAADSHVAELWAPDVADAPLAAKWASLEQLPPGTLGRRVTEFYRARGFTYPGLPGSAPPSLAQHDWVHVVADYGTTVESELEVFALIARANDDLRAFSLLAMVVSLFETGYLRAGAGLFEYSPGHLSADDGMAARVADAMRRGAECAGSIDFLKTDWFELAPQRIEDVRAHFCMPDKSDHARAAGSVGPWERGGISPFQVKTGTSLAEREGRPYDPYGAAP